MLGARGDSALFQGKKGDPGLRCECQVTLVLGELLLLLIGGLGSGGELGLVRSLGEAVGDCGRARRLGVLCFVAITMGTGEICSP